MSGCKHTPCPEGYSQWHAWAEQKSKTHVQHRCPNCGLWSIWKRKPQHNTETSKGKNDG
jgi:hypothetical protein